MKTPNKTLKGAADVCHGSRLHPLLSRHEKKTAVIYCERIMDKRRKRREADCQFLVCPYL
jgi:hypothetical protein